MRVCPACHTIYLNDDPVCSRDGLATLTAGPNPDGDSLLGTRLGDFVITAALGQDGVGAVYRAEQAARGRAATVRVLHPDHARKSQAVERLFAEAKAVGQLGHENIVELLNLGFLSNRSPYLMTELLKGEALDRYLEKRGQLPLVEAFEILMPVLAALQAAHAGGIIHRALEPRSIFLAEGPQGARLVKLMDFGVAHLLSDRAATGAAYLAPEQAAGRPGLDHRADIYAAGAILYEMLVGEPPFRGETSEEILKKLLTTAPVPPRQRRPGVPARIDDLILRALAKDPAGRVQSASEFAQRFAADLPTAAMSPQQIQLLLSATSSITKLPPGLLDAKPSGGQPDGERPLIKTRVSPKSAPPAPQVAPPAPQVAPPTASPSTELLIAQILKPRPASQEAPRPKPPPPPAPSRRWPLIAGGALVLVALALALLLLLPKSGEEASAQGASSAPTSQEVQPGAP